MKFLSILTNRKSTNKGLTDNGASNLNHMIYERFTVIKSMLRYAETKLICEYPMRVARLNPGT